jgi:hypothetical protein
MFKVILEVVLVGRSKTLSKYELFQTILEFFVVIVEDFRLKRQHLFLIVAWSVGGGDAEDGGEEGGGDEGGGDEGGSKDSCNAEFEHPETLPSPSSCEWHTASLLSPPPGHLAALLAVGTAANAWRAGQAGTGL